MENSNQVMKKQWSEYRDKIIGISTIPFATQIDNWLILHVGKYLHDTFYYTDENTNHFDPFAADLNLMCNDSTAFYENLITNIEKYVSKNLANFLSQNLKLDTFISSISNLNDKQFHVLCSIITVYLQEISLLQKDSFFHQINYDNLFFTQGPAIINLHYESCPNNVFFTDHPRTPYFENTIKPGVTEEKIIENIDTETNFSRYMTVMFYDHSFLNSDKPPSDDEIDFWIALDSIIVDLNQKDYLSQIMNANDNELNKQQKALKAKLHDNDFRKKIIALAKAQYENFNDVAITQEENKTYLRLNISRYHFEHIMHTPWAKLNSNEQKFKKEFFQGIAITALLRTYSGIKFIPEDPSIEIPKNDDGSVLGALSILYAPTKIASQTKYVQKSEEACEGISEVINKDFRDEVQNKLDTCIRNLDMDKKLREYENEHVKFEDWHTAHQIDKISEITNGEIKNFTEEPDTTNFIVNFINGKYKTIDPQYLIEAISTILQNEDQNGREIILDQLTNSEKIFSHDYNKKFFLATVYLSLSKIKEINLVEKFLDGTLDIIIASDEDAVSDKLYDYIKLYKAEPDKQREFVMDIIQSRKLRLSDDTKIKFLRISGDANFINEFVTGGFGNLPSPKTIEKIYALIPNEEKPQFMQSVLSSKLLTSYTKNLVYLQDSQRKHNGFLKRFINGKFNNLCNDKDKKAELVSKVAEKIYLYKDDPEKQKKLMVMIHYSKHISDEIKIAVFKKSIERYPMTKGNHFTKVFARGKFKQDNCQIFLEKTLEQYKNSDGQINFSKVKRLFIKIANDPRTTPQVKNFLNEIIKEENFNLLMTPNLNRQNFVQTILNRSTQQKDSLVESPQAPQQTI